MNQLLKPSVLVVDHDTDNCDLINMVLASADYHVFTATTVEEALATARTEILDLVITDVQLGYASGLSLIDSIRNIPEREDLPAMMMSARQLTDVVNDAGLMNVQFQIRKPFHTGVFLELVQQSLWMPHLINSHIHRFDIAQSIAEPHFAMPAGLGSKATRLEFAQTYFN